MRDRYDPNAVSESDRRTDREFETGVPQCEEIVTLRDIAVADRPSAGTAHNGAIRAHDGDGGDLRCRLDLLIEIHGGRRVTDIAGDRIRPRNIGEANMARDIAQHSLDAEERAVTSLDE